MNKANVIATLNSLPEEFKTEELIEKLLFIEKVQQAKLSKSRQAGARTEKDQHFGFSLN